MSVTTDRTVSVSSETSEYDISDLLSLVASPVSASSAINKQNEDAQTRASNPENRMSISLRERRRSRVQGMPLNVCGLPNMSQMGANGNIQLQPSALASKKAAVWRRALNKAIASGDPWSSEGFDSVQPEVAARYRFDTRSRKWVVDQVHVKMQDKPFGRGAMRQCFRLKKKSNFATRSHDFATASNCVAKSYIDPAVTRQTYFDDVYLQMDAKYWAERFNRHDPDPPKKIDLIQVAILEFVNRPGSPLFHLEHFIEGEYIKYNSNSGFIDAHARMTPQTFSHFTFEESKHRLMVVDVQGVGDLYTDPQIHTAYTSEMYSADEAPPYGDGNLGVRGMALFFYSHHCNQICGLLGLQPFSHSAYETSNVAHRWRSLSSSCSSQPAASVSGADSPLGATVVRQHSRSRSGGSCSSDDPLTDSSPLVSAAQVSIFPIREDDKDADGNAARRVRSSGSSCSHADADSTNGDDDDKHALRMRSRARIESQMRPEDATTMLADIVDPLDADEERHPKRLSPEEILALIHLDFARCYDSGRFAAVDQLLLAAAGATPIDSVVKRTADKQHGELNANGEVRLSRDECEAALFHLAEAAKLGNHDAVLLLARVYLNMERDILNCISDSSFANDVFNSQRGLQYMQEAAKFSANCALFLAELYDSGKHCKSNLQDFSVNKDSHAAIMYYAKAVELMEDASDDEYSVPLYEVHAKLAALYAADDIRDFTQSYECYTSAAEAATTAMKGKLAARYYQLAEEMSALIEE